MVNFGAAATIRSVDIQKSIKNSRYLNKNCVMSRFRDKINFDMVALKKMAIIKKSE